MRHRTLRQDVIHTCLEMNRPSAVSAATTSARPTTARMMRSIWPEPPYFPSPTIGWPISAMWARSWWVRPARAGREGVDEGRQVDPPRRAGGLRRRGTGDESRQDERGEEATRGEGRAHGQFPLNRSLRASKSSR